MKGIQFFDNRSQLTPAYVLDHPTPDDVARNMIKGGQQAAFYIFNMDEAYRRVKHFQKMMPRIKIFYAMKSNDTDMMLRLAVSLGLGFDCASPGEIYKVRKLGVKPKDIIYAMPCKSAEEMKYARSTGIKYATFDRSCELKKIKKSWPEAELLIRIRIDGEAERKLGLKFGCDFETEAISLLEEAAGLGLHVAGVAFHVGSACFSLDSYVLGLRQARSLFDHEARNGRRMNVVDIGGGFLSHRTDSIDEVSYLINDTLAQLFPDPTVKIFAEPGGYLCDSAFTMFCGVFDAQKVIRNNVPVNMYFLNNGVYGTLRFNEKWHKINKLQLSDDVEPLIEEQTVLWGPTCDSVDRVATDFNINLPQCSPGDWLVVEPHGAYTITLATRFSCLDPPLIRAVISRELCNFIRQSSVFQGSHFIFNPDLSTPLPSPLPPVCEIIDDLEIITSRINVKE